MSASVMWSDRCRLKTSRELTADVSSGIDQKADDDCITTRTADESEPT